MFPGGAASNGVSRGGGGKSLAISIKILIKKPRGKKETCSDRGDRPQPPYPNLNTMSYGYQLLLIVLQASLSR